MHFIQQCRNDYESIVKLLIDIGFSPQPYGVDIHCKDVYGDNAFMFAYTGGHESVAKWLHSIGVDIYCKNNKGMNAFDIACYYQVMNTSYASSAMRGHDSVAKWLIDIGFKPDINNEFQKHYYEYWKTRRAIQYIAIVVFLTEG